MYIVVDITSRNVLGECDTFQQAQALFLEYVAYAPQAAEDLRILNRRGETKSVPPEDIEAAKTALAC